MKKFVIEIETKGIRLDKAISNKYQELSRTNIQKLIEEEKIKVNGKNQKASYKVEDGDVIQIEKIEEEVINLEPQDIPLDIIYEDKDIIVINKQKGLVVHPASGNMDGTLVNAIKNIYKGSLSSIGGETRPGIIHRLDKDTSGLIIVAKTNEAHIEIVKQLKEHTVTKTYIALVRGSITENEATINMPITRNVKDRKKMTVAKDGKNAITHFKVLKRYDGYTLVEVQIETGRTHQIRVHMSTIGNPVVGDKVYSNGRNPFGVQGQMLHAWRLGFCHPITKNMLELEAPLPEYFEEIIKQLE